MKTVQLKNMLNQKFGNSNTLVPALVPNDTNMHKIVQNITRKIQMKIHCKGYEKCKNLQNSCKYVNFAQRY